MKKFIPLIIIKTFTGRPGEYSLFYNDLPYHIDKLNRILEDLYEEDSGFLDYEVYKDEYIHHSGRILVRPVTDFHSLITNIAVHKLSTIFVHR